MTRVSDHQVGQVRARSFGVFESSKKPEKKSGLAHREGCCSISHTVESHDRLHCSSETQPVAFGVSAARIMREVYEYLQPPVFISENE